MMKFTVLVIALVLTPALHASVVVSRDDITNYPGVLYPGIETRPLPLPLEPELRPEILPIFPELRPEVIPELRPEVLPSFPELRPEVIPELRPEVVEKDPCAACFGYISSLIVELATAVEPETPEIGFLPHPIQPSPPAILPAPVEPEIELRPLPVYPEVPEIGFRPLPIFPVAPEVGIRPLPAVIPALTNF